MKIRVLPDHVVNQIAAGEVVDRPASVVRELVDNSIDAGATQISVTIEQGGQSLIRVVDNGCGMRRDDALLAFERHATSKVWSPEDLTQIASLGFRGEALPSIAAVSKVMLRSRVEGADTGVSIKMAGGTLQDVNDVAAPVGTEIEIGALFYNVPARRKFLKTPRTDELKVRAWLTHSSLAHPTVHYRLFNDDKQVLNLPPREDSRSRAQTLLRGSTVSFSRTLASGGRKVAIEGLLAHPSQAQGEVSSLVLLVNRRLINDRMLLRAVKEGFASTLKDREFPLGFVAIDLPPSEVDVNVHPQKSEVRFRNSQAIFALVREAVRDAVMSFKGPVEITRGAWASDRPRRGEEPVSLPPSPVRAMNAAPYLDQAAVAQDLFTAPEVLEVAFANEDTSAREEFSFSRLRYIGQILKCYLLCEAEERFVVVDMHAAHERYNYNLIRNGFRTRAIASQRLLVPLTVSLSQEGVEYCLAQHELLSRFGFEVEEFGPGTLVVRAAPAVLSSHKIEEALRELATIAGEEGQDSASGIIEERIDHAAARIACHASVRAGKDMSRPEVEALFAALDSTEFSAACPHGRPIVVTFEPDQIEKWFGRDR